jgi:uncharacterized protein (DUF433 family)
MSGLDPAGQRDEAQAWLAKAEEDLENGRRPRHGIGSHPVLRRRRRDRGRRAMKFTRITVKPGQMGGVPCIRGLRIPVATVVGMVADGMTEAEILSAYPDLERGDLAEALRYAAEAVRERELPLVAS